MAGNGHSQLRVLRHEDTQLGLAMLLTEAGRRLYSHQSSETGASLLTSLEANAGHLQWHKDDCSLNGNIGSTYIMLSHCIPCRILS